MKRKYLKYVLMLIAIASIITPPCVWAEQTLSTDAEVKEELLRLRVELDSAIALLASHGVKRLYKHTVALKFGFHIEPGMSSVEGTLKGYGGASAYVRLSSNLNWPVSPYLAIANGGGPVGEHSDYHGYFSVGVEKPFIYNSGFSIIPSAGAHIGEGSYREEEYGGFTNYTLGGAHAGADFAFSHKRLSIYFSTGVKFTYIWSENASMLTFPVGWGVMVKI